MRGRKLRWRSLVPGDVVGQKWRGGSAVSVLLHRDSRGARWLSLTSDSCVYETEVGFGRLDPWEVLVDVEGGEAREPRR